MHTIILTINQLIKSDSNTLSGELAANPVTTDLPSFKVFAGCYESLDMEMGVKHCVPARRPRLVCAIGVKENVPPRFRGKIRAKLIDTSAEFARLHSMLV